MLWPWQLLLTKGMVVAMMGSEDDLSAACWVWDARSYSKGRFPFQIISELIAILSAVQGKKKKNQNLEELTGGKVSLIK